MTTSAQPWFVATGLRKTFDGSVAITAADLALMPGEIRGIVGPNGAGKSTLMQIFAGVHQPDIGQMHIDGHPISFRRPADAIASGISLVPQEMRLASNLTVAENIVLGHEPRRFGTVLAGASRRVATEALARLEMPIDPDATVGELTSVERRLVMVARTLARDARLIILDEPTAALAPHEADAILSVVRGLSATGVSFLYVSHRFDDIERVASTVSGIRDARVIAHLTRSEITRERLVAMVTPVDQQSHRVSRETGEATHGGRSETTALEVTDLAGGPLAGVSLSVAAGEILGVAGLSGSGVDQLMAMVAGIDRRESGTVVAKGVPLASGDRVQAVQGGVAYVPGNRGLAILPNHDVKANITVTSLVELGRLGLPSAAREESLVRQLMTRVQLSAKLSQTISSLSGGNQQKAVFARWMACEATVLLLHDPTAGVDVRARAQIHQRVRELAGSGIGILLVTTDVPELAGLSDRVLVLDRGRSVALLEGDRVTEPTILAAMVAQVPAKPTPNVNDAPTS